MGVPIVMNILFLISGMASPEYKAMIACTSDLVTGMASCNVDSIADLLLSESLIAGSVHDKVFLPMMTPTMKARELVSNVTSKVKVSPAKEFPKFIGVLRSSEGAEYLEELLQAAYSEPPQFLNVF